MGDGVAFELHLDHVFLRVLGALFDGVGNFVGFAVADADGAFFVSDNGEGGEAEAASAFHDFRAAVDIDDFLDHFGGVRVGGRTVTAGAATVAVATFAAASAFTTASVATAFASASAGAGGAVVRVGGGVGCGCGSGGFGSGCGRSGRGGGGFGGGLGG
jgi:hypothetical protein